MGLAPLYTLFHHSPLMGQGRAQGFDLEKENGYTKHKSYKLYKKYNINFNLALTNLYNLKNSIANTTIKLEVFKNLDVAVAPGRRPVHA